MKSFLSIKNLTKTEIMQLIKRGLEFKNGAKAKVNASVSNIFLEPSTRTMMSFQKAQKDLGINIYDLPIANSSFKKGETLEDTLLNLKSMGINAFVIRTTEENYWDKFTNQFTIINGGDGTKNHPSQALLDAMTIYEHFQTLSNLKVAIIGDIKHSRVFHSNKDLLQKFNSQVDGFGPKVLGGNNQDISEVLGNYDVIMLLRIQHERLKTDFSMADYNAKFGINEHNVSKLKKHAIILHPGPVNRNVEISEKILYNHPQSKILEQVNNGVNVRKAILEFACKNL